MDLTVQLDYGAAEGCPPASTLDAIVTGRLGYSPFRDDAFDRVIVRIERSGRGLEGHLDWQNPRGGSIGERTFPSRTGDCPELTRVIGFALALQIQLMAAAAEPTVSAEPASPADKAAPEAPPPPPPPVVPAPVRVAETSSAGKESRPRGPSVLVGAGIAGAVGISSDPVPLARLFVTLEWSHVAVEVGGEASLPSTTQVPGGASFSQGDLLASLAGCGVLSMWRACAITKVGEIRATGQGVDVPLTSSGLMVQVGLRVAASHPVTRHIYVLGHVDGLAQLTRGTVTLDAVPAWTTPRFAAVFGIDLGVRFR